MTTGQLRSFLDRELKSGTLSIDSKVVLETKDRVFEVCSVRAIQGPRYAVSDNESNTAPRRLVLVAG
jgi:hypothetical protein